MIITRRSPSTQFSRCCNKTTHINITRHHPWPRIRLCAIIMFPSYGIPPCNRWGRIRPLRCRPRSNWMHWPCCSYSNLSMTMTLNMMINYTSIGADKIGTMSKRRVVEGIVAIGHSIFITHTNCQPITAILLDLKCHLAWLIAFLLQRWLEETKVVVIALGWFDEMVGHYWDAAVLELGTELEIGLWIENTWVLCCFLQYFTKSFNLCPNFGLFSFKIFLYFLLYSSDSLFNLRSTYLILLLFRIQRHTSQQFLHQCHKSLILNLFCFDVLQCLD